MSTRIIDLNDNNTGALIAPEWLPRAEAVHRQLRPDLAPNYAGTMGRVFAGGGRMSVAVVDDVVAGVAVFRVYVNTADGRHMYVDDLVTDETRRSSGVGKALLDHLQKRAVEQGCKSFKLDSGCQRQQAHKFYFREGLVVCAFHFRKMLSG
ncbi:MAG: GNAT family N-acetyltransferase [Deltaproteobacteria bacterium]|nr:GNAT family N-acetyltransferase [Deltaproteobacteria bacterium]